MKKNTPFALLMIWSSFVLGCGAKWNVTEQRFFRYSNKDMRVAGRIELTEDASELSPGPRGTDYEYRLYSDEYSTIIQKGSDRLGRELEESGGVGKKEIFKTVFSEPRLGATENSYPILCAEIKIEDSNVSDWTRIGCVRESDPASDSPTGGIGRE